LPWAWHANAAALTLTRVSTAQFYDGLADTYHALYPDWRSASRAQGRTLDRLLSRWHHSPADIADVACGIGTQLIGLAGLRHRVLGAGISARAVRRARRECAAAGVPAALLVADMRELPLDDSCADAVICADNALPHLLTGDDVLAALEQMHRILRPATPHGRSAARRERSTSDHPPFGAAQRVVASGSRTG
jgi:glycine/sarcosine N-methyltransferase